MHHHAWKKSLYALSLIGACLLTGATAFAQLQAGRIVGQVYDPQHAAVPGATVTVANSSTNLSQVVKQTLRAITLSLPSIRELIR